MQHAFVANDNVIADLDHVVLGKSTLFQAIHLALSLQHAFLAIDNV